MRRMILVPLLIVIVILAIVGGIGYFIYNNYYFYSTDDAQVSAPLVSINSPANGQLTTMSVKVGDTVNAGQTIGTITPVAPATTSTAGTAASSAPQAVNITSPISGTIVQASAVQGQAIAAETNLVQISNPGNASVTAYIDENQANNVKVGQSVDIHIDAYPSTSYTGHIQQVVAATASSFSLLPTQDNASGNFTKVGQRLPVIITLDGGNGGNNLYPGLSAEVTIHLH